MNIVVRDNLIVRSLTADDARKTYAVINSNRDYLRTWLPWVDGTDSADVTERTIALWQNAYENKSDIVLGVFYNSEYVGNIGLHDIKRSNISGMIGYWLAEDCQGLGIMTDCVRALTDYGFNELELNRIYIHCATANTKSRAIPERLGFVQEGVLQDGEYRYGQFYDLAVYGGLKRNWQKIGFMPVV